MATVGVGEVARFCRISTRRVQQLVKEGMPQIERGKFNLAEAAQWYIGFLQDAIKRQGSGRSNDSLKKRQAEVLKYRAQKEKLEFKVRSGELIETEKAKQVIREAMVIIATSEDSLAGRLAGELARIDEPALIRQTLLKELRRGRSQAANKFERAGIMDDSGAVVQATAGEDAGRVGGSEQDTSAGQGGTGTVAKSEDAVHDPDSSGNTAPDSEQDCRGDGVADGEDGQRTECDRAED